VRKSGAGLLARVVGACVLFGLAVGSTGCKSSCFCRATSASPVAEKTQPDEAFLVVLPVWSLKSHRTTNAVFLFDEDGHLMGAVREPFRSTLTLKPGRRRIYSFDLDTKVSDRIDVEAEPGRVYAVALTRSRGSNSPMRFAVPSTPSHAEWILRRAARTADESVPEREAYELRTRFTEAMMHRTARDTSSGVVGHALSVPKARYLAELEHDCRSPMFVTKYNECLARPITVDRSP